MAPSIFKTYLCIWHLTSFKKYLGGCIKPLLLVVILIGLLAAVLIVSVSTVLVVTLLLTGACLLIVRWGRYLEPLLGVLVVLGSACFHILLYINNLLKF